MTAGTAPYTIRRAPSGVLEHHQLIRDVLLGVSVVIERDADGLFHGRTDAFGDIRSWSATSMQESELRRLAKAALAVRGEP